MPEPPFSLKCLDHVVLRVRDIERMRDFYCRVLGCSPEQVQHDVGLWQLRAGASLIDLVTVDGPIGRQGGAPPAEQGHNMDHLCLEVGHYDQAAILAWLQSQGVHVGEVGTRYGARGSGPSIYLQDPEGNRVELKGPATSPPTKRS